MLLVYFLKKRISESMISGCDVKGRYYPSNLISLHVGYY
jgi:hypothetical protein